jgi:hypothetical protein
LQQDPETEGIDGHNQWSNYFWTQICWLEAIKDQIIIILAPRRKARQGGVNSQPPEALTSISTGRARPYSAPIPGMPPRQKLPPMQVDLRYDIQRHQNSPRAGKNPIANDLSWIDGIFNDPTPINDFFPGEYLPL